MKKIYQNQNKNSIYQKIILMKIDIIINKKLQISKIKNRIL
jgi:hypothetical protein